MHALSCTRPASHCTRDALPRCTKSMAIASYYLAPNSHRVRQRMIHNFYFMHQVPAHSFGQDPRVVWQRTSCCISVSTTNGDPRCACALEHAV